MHWQQIQTELGSRDALSNSAKALLIPSAARITCTRSFTSESRGNASSVRARQRLSFFSFAVNRISGQYLARTVANVTRPVRNLIATDSVLVSQIFLSPPHSPRICVLPTYFLSSLSLSYFVYAQFQRLCSTLNEHRRVRLFALISRGRRRVSTDRGVRQVMQLRGNPSTRESRNSILGILHPIRSVVHQPINTPITSLPGRGEKHQHRSTCTRV